MNLIRGALSTQHYLFLSPPLPKSLFLLPRRRHSIPINQLSPFSTTIKYTLKSQQPKKSRTPKSSSTFKKQPLSTWPRPTQIPYQSKLSNSVNLIGKIQMPIQFHATPDGKHMTTAFISQQNGDFNGNSSCALLIPVVFEGDLAHTVACHVKLNDCVYVTGKLSLDPLPFVSTEIQGKFYVIGSELNFVQGLEMKVGVMDQDKNVEKDNLVKEQVGDKKSSVDKDSKVKKEWGDFFDRPNQWVVITSEDDVLKGAIEGFERKVDGKRIDLDSSTPVWVYKKLEKLNFENKIEGKKIEPLKTKIEEKKSEPLKTEKKSSDNVGGSTKEGDAVLNSWRDLVKNPVDWRDYREKKSSGSVKANYPDFKHKTNGTALWLNRAPNWVLPGLEGLDIGGKGRIEDGWKSLIENPDKWWDYRSRKTSIKAPDFKHKETGEALWLNSSPEWAFSKLPPLKEQNVDVGNKKAYVA